MQGYAWGLPPSPPSPSRVEQPFSPLVCMCFWLQLRLHQRAAPHPRSKSCLAGCLAGGGLEGKRAVRTRSWEERGGAHALTGELGCSPIFRELQRAQQIGTGKGKETTESRSLSALGGLRWASRPGLCQANHFKAAHRQIAGEEVTGRGGEHLKAATSARSAELRWASRSVLCKARYSSAARAQANSSLPPSARSSPRSSAGSWPASTPSALQSSGSLTLGMHTMKILVSAYPPLEAAPELKAGPQQGSYAVNAVLGLTCSFCMQVPKK